MIVLGHIQKRILKRIALAGYDSDFFFAPDDNLIANLPDVAQYERAKKDVHDMEDA